MKIYHYHPMNNSFLCEGEADESPLEPGVFLVPAHATRTPPPEINEGMEAVYANGSWLLIPIEITSNPSRTLAEIAAEKYSLVQAEKCRVRDSGMLISGTLFDTDLAARISYLELSGLFSADPTFKTDWKASAGVWVLMDALMFQGVMSAGKTHIQTAFAWQASKNLAIETALIAEDREALEAISTVFATNSATDQSAGA